MSGGAPPTGDVPGGEAARAERMARSVRRLRERRQARGTIARNLAVVGTLGWLMVVPTLVGAFVGRWLDRRLGSGIFWSATLIFLGAVGGSYFVWQRVHQE